MSQRTIHLFRKGLRLHDNPALLGALESSSALFPLYVLDRDFMDGAMRSGPLRWRFVLQCLEDLDGRLRALGSRLYVLRDLVSRWAVTQISYDTEVEPRFKPWRRSGVSKHTRSMMSGGVMSSEVTMIVCVWVCLCVTDVCRVCFRIIKANGGSPPLTYKKFLHVLSVLGEPEKAVREITAEDFV